MGLFVVDAGLCSRCGACAEECPRLVIELPPDGSPPVFDTAACHDCGHCVAVCPTGALSSSDAHPADLMAADADSLPSVERVRHFLRTRRSIRRYEDRPVPRETLAVLLDTARWAPSSGNTQTVEWVVLGGDSMRRFIADTNGWLEEHPLPPMYATTQAKAEELGIDLVCRNAPHAIIAHTPRGRETDGAVSLAYLELAAYAAGLGACWSGFANGVIRASGALRDWLGIPDSHASCGVMLLGYPAHRFRRVPLRKPTKVEWL